MNFYLKLKETFFSVAPIMAIVLILSLTIAPLQSELIVTFIASGIMIIFGLAIFLLGVDIGILSLGEQSGAALTSKKNLPLLLGAAFLIGFIVTIAEPDVQVLANQVKTIAPNVSKSALIISIACGVGFFVSLGILRTVISIPLKVILIISYIVLFALAFVAPKNFQGVAFDSGGATTGPMTVPFIMALGMGVAAVRSKNSSKKGSEDDSFGLTGIASVGPIFAVLVYGIFSSKGNLGEIESLSNETEAVSFGISYLISHLPVVAKEVVNALAPLALMAAFFQIFLLKMPRMQVVRMIRGFVLSFIGLVIFLSGAQGGFMNTGEQLGMALGKLCASGEKSLVLFDNSGSIERLIELSPNFLLGILIAIGCIFGAVVVCAEPAVWVLTDQVEELSGGTIKRKMMLIALSAGVAISVGLSMTRIIFRFSLWYILIPGYFIALLLTFFCPKLFTGIAFDSGGVASGPMTSTFILSFALGTSASCGGNPAVDAFGVIALVAMTPLIAIQILGIIFKIKTSKSQKKLSVGEKNE